MALAVYLLLSVLISLPSVLVSGEDFPVECPYPCLPPPSSAVTNCPPPPPSVTNCPPPPPSAPTEPVYGYPPTPPGAPEYEGFYPSPPEYFPYYTPPSSMFPAPPPPNPILPWFPWYYQTPPSSGRVTTNRILSRTTAIFIAVFAGLILF